MFAACVLLVARADCSGPSRRLTGVWNGLDTADSVSGSRDCDSVFQVWPACRRLSPRGRAGAQVPFFPLRESERSRDRQRQRNPSLCLSVTPLASLCPPPLIYARWGQVVLFVGFGSTFCSQVQFAGLPAAPRYTHKSAPVRVGWTGSPKIGWTGSP